MEIFILFWILFSIGIGFLASERGRSPIGWGLLALITSPLLGLILVLLLRDIKVEAANREREEIRHREQLAAISSNRPNETTNMRGADQSRWPTSKSPELPTAATSSPVLVADELEKLASLRDKGVLTPAEFAEQKARLLGKSNESAPAVPNGSSSRIRISAEADLSTFDSCKSALIDAGCRVSNPSDNTWEVLDSSGISRIVRSPQELKQLAKQFQIS